MGITVGNSIDGPVKPLAPFNNIPQRAAHSDFINYKDGSIMNGVQHWKKMDSVFFEYLDHKETKFDGDVGILERRHLIVGSTINLGKESNNLEESELFGVQGSDYQTYRSKNDFATKEKELNDIILSLRTKDVEKHGINKLQLIRMKKKIGCGEKLKLSSKIRRRLECAINTNIKSEI